MSRVLIWDAPIRLFHALFALGLALAFGLAELGHEGPTFVLHMGVGLVLLLLVALRVAWGFVGSKHARFAALTLAPRELGAYLGSVFGGELRSYVGHNPATSAALPVMLALAAALGGTGLTMAVGGGEAFEELHELLAFAFVGVAVVHVVGVAVHQLRHGSIVQSMVDGHKEAAADEAIAHGRPAAAAVLAAIVLACGLVLATGYDATRGTLTLPGLGVLGGDDDAEEGGDEGDGDEKLDGAARGVGPGASGRRAAPRDDDDHDHDD